jgi:hypothetical protein
MSVLAAKPALDSGRFTFMLSRRLLGIVVLSFAVVIPAGAQSEKEKAVKEAKDNLDKAEKALKDNKDDAKKKDLEKAVDDARAALKKAEDAKDDKKDDKKEKAKLEWKFKKDDVFYQKMYTKTIQTMKVMNNDVKQTQEQTFYFKWSIGDQKDGNWVIKQKIEGVKMKIQIGNQNIDYDSTNEKDTSQNNPLADFFKALKDSEFTITLNPKDMTVTKLEGRMEFVDKLGKQNPQMKPLLETILSEKALMQMAEPTFAAIPGREEPVGGTWSKKTSLDMGPIGRYDNEYKYTYDGKDKEKKSFDRIKVETQLKYTPPTDAVGGGGGGLPFKIRSADLKSTKAEGSILFDPEKGRIDSSSMSLKLNGSLNIEIGGQTTEVTLDQDQSSTVENSDKTFIETKKEEKKDK